MGLTLGGRVGSARQKRCDKSTRRRLATDKCQNSV